MVAMNLEKPVFMFPLRSTDKDGQSGQSGQRWAAPSLGLHGVNFRKAAAREAT